ncbi:MAG: hypothetical protein KDE27_10860 [Planctomycetes bacterium]|nr:hypothetical protein [Planctomycetota bacterium]
MQYTLRNLPAHLDRAIRERARLEHKSLNEVAIDGLMRAFGLLDGESPPVRDLSDIAGSWVEDADMLAALEEQRRVDPDLWR